MIFYHPNSQPLVMVFKSWVCMEQHKYLFSLEICKSQPQRYDRMVWGETQKFVVLMGAPGEFDAGAERDAF